MLTLAERWMRWLFLCNYEPMIHWRASHISSATQLKLVTPEQTLKPAIGVNHAVVGYATPQRLCCRQRMLSVTQLSGWNPARKFLSWNASTLHYLVWKDVYHLTHIVLVLLIISQTQWILHTPRIHFIIPEEWEIPSRWPITGWKIRNTLNFNLWDWSSMVSYSVLQKKNWFTYTSLGAFVMGRHYHVLGCVIQLEYSKINNLR